MLKQETIGDILDSEKQAVLDASENYNDWFINADQFNGLFQDFLDSVSPDQFIFSIFLSSARKHALLALFSSVRLHYVQAMMNVRQVLEAGATAAYAIAHPNKKEDFWVEKNGLIEEPKKLSHKRNSWLDKNYKGGSDAIKRMKKLINQSVAHNSLTYGMKNFKMDNDARKFITPFFDFEERHHVEGNLWLIGNVVMGLMDLFYGVNRDYGGLVFSGDFIVRLKKLEKQNNSLKELSMESEWFKNATKRASSA